MRALVVAGLALACSVSPAAAQPSGGRSADPEPPPRIAVGFYFGAAQNSPVGTHYGVTPNRDHLFLGLHSTFSVWRTPRWSIAYAPEVVPLLIVNRNPKTRDVELDPGFVVTVSDGVGPVGGFGLSPIGVEGQGRLMRRLSGYAAGAAGVVWFSREVPVPPARAFNYTFEFGGGLLWQYDSRLRLRAGYKFHHLSNWYTAIANPGIDGHVFLLGLECVLK